MPYKDPIIQKYLDLLEDELSGVRTFYNGTRVRIPASSLPMIMIDIESETIGDFSTSEDEHLVDLVLTYIVDMRKETSATELIEQGLQKVKRVLVGRDEDDYTLKSDSVADILRKNLSIDSNNNLRTDINSVSIITPSEVATGRMPGYWSAEGTVRFQAHFIQQR